MSQPLIDGIAQSEGYARVGAGSVAEFLAVGGPALLLFTGDCVQRPEAADVAVIARELTRAAAGSLRAGIVDRVDEAALMPRFQVLVLPSLVFLDGDRVVEVVPRIQDWPAYGKAVAKLTGVAAGAAISA